MHPALPTAGIRTSVRLPMRLGNGFATEAVAVTFDRLVDGREHLAVRLGVDRMERSDDPPLVRLHSECLTGDVLGSGRCDCGPQLSEAVTRLAAVGGWLLYLRQEGRGIGLYNKLDAYRLQDGGLDTYAANVALGHGTDERDYTVAAQMLDALGIGEVRLLSNNPDKAAQLRAAGLRIREQVRTGVHLTAANASYLSTKARLGAHRMDLDPGHADPVAAQPAFGQCGDNGWHNGQVRTVTS